jgi:hypothetical protein
MLTLDPSSSYIEEQFSIARDAAGSSYVLVPFRDSINPAGTPLRSNNGSQDMAIFEISSLSRPVWAAAIGGPGLDIPRSLAISGRRLLIIGSCSAGFTQVGRFRLTLGGAGYL